MGRKAQSGTAAKHTGSSLVVSKYHVGCRGQLLQQVGLSFIQLLPAQREDMVHEQEQPRIMVLLPFVGGQDRRSQLTKCMHEALKALQGDGLPSNDGHKLQSSSSLIYFSPVLLQYTTTLNWKI